MAQWAKVGQSRSIMVMAISTVPSGAWLHDSAGATLAPSHV